MATMCGITEVNPLPPHYRCDHCHKMVLTPPELASVGVDLPDKNCEICGHKLAKDGFDIPFEVFLGFKGDKVKLVTVDTKGNVQEAIKAFNRLVDHEKAVAVLGPPVSNIGLAIAPIAKQIMMERWFGDSQLAPVVTARSTRRGSCRVCPR